MDEDGYVYMDPPKRDLQASKESKGCSFNLCCKIVLGISVVGNVALAVLLILLIRGDFQVYPVSKSAPYQIQSCLLNCIPCRSATNSVKAENEMLSSDIKGRNVPQRFPDEASLRETYFKPIPKSKEIEKQSDELEFKRNVHLPVTQYQPSENDSNLTLDPSTAHPQLHLSSDLKSVRWKGMKEQVKGSPLRYELWPSVLSHESFNSGKLCWEVEVVAEGNWGVGIVRESANRNGHILLQPRGGYWGVQRINGHHQATTQPRTNLLLRHPPRRIRVSLDYSQGLIAFFDGDTNAEIFTFPKANFAGEKIHAWFLIYKWNGQLLLHP